MLSFLRPRLKPQVFRGNSGSVPSGPGGNVCKAGKMERLALPSAAAGRDGAGLPLVSARKAAKTRLPAAFTAAVTCAPGHPDRGNCPAWTRDVCIYRRKLLGTEQKEQLPNPSSAEFSGNCKMSLFGDSKKLGLWRSCASSGHGTQASPAGPVLLQAGGRRSGRHCSHMLSLINLVSGLALVRSRMRVNSGGRSHLSIANVTRKRWWVGQTKENRFRTEDDKESFWKMGEISSYLTWSLTLQRLGITFLSAC